MAQTKVRRVEREQIEYKPLTEKEQLKLQYPNMIVIGYWGKDKYDLEWPWPQYYVDENQTDNMINMVAEYLDRGAVVEYYMGCSRCRICRERVGSRELSDGKYVWPEGLSHYVREHKVKLPDEFIQHIIDRLEEDDGLYREDL